MTKDEAAGRAIRVFISRAGMLERRVAEQSEPPINLGAFSLMLNGKRRINDQYMSRIAKALNVSVTQIKKEARHILISEE